MTVIELKKLMDVAIEASIIAGEKILEVYESDFAVEHKDDKSPLTLADQKGHDVIVSYLEKTELPILSEEGAKIPYSERKDWEYSWTVDPLDGTKEFVKRNGEFTVNIALIHNQKAIGGVIFVPVKNWLYFGLVGEGAYKLCRTAPVEVSKIKDLRFDNLVKAADSLPMEQTGKFKVVGSRSHMSPETEEFIEELKKEHGEIEIVSMGSSLKICLVAEGAANVYPRFAPTMEWDTAAGQGIAIAAGKDIVDYKTGETMLYNREELLNNWFIVR
jgi:3'(2'), 5'-bisphosphate nucleotidase